jgi:perosamine synthetase
MGDLWDWPQPDSIRIPIAQPWITELEIGYCNSALKDNWIGSNGPFNSKAEAFLSAYFNQPTLTVSNGSVALMLALRALGVGANDEVLVPNLTYAATASSVSNVGAIPVLCDVEGQDWGISVNSMSRMLSKKTKAIIVVHLYGVPANIESIIDFAKKHKLFVIEDCAESFGALVKGKKVGTFGDAATFSFFANKLITSGEGGAVSSSNHKVYDMMKLLRGQGMDPHRRYYFIETGYNFRMTNPQAALLLGQLERLPEITVQRQEVESHYQSLLGEYAIGPTPGSTSASAPWIFTTAFPLLDVGKRMKLAEQLAQNGIETRPVFWALSDMPAFKNLKRDRTPTTKVISSSGISLPTGIHVTHQDRVEIAATITDFLRGLV